MRAIHPQKLGAHDRNSIGPGEVRGFMSELRGPIMRCDFDGRYDAGCSSIVQPKTPVCVNARAGAATVAFCASKIWPEQRTSRLRRIRSSVAQAESPSIRERRLGSKIEREGILLRWRMSVPVVYHRHAISNETY